MEIYVTYQPSEAPMRWSVARVSGLRIIDSKSFETNEAARSHIERIEQLRRKYSLRKQWTVH